LKDIKLYFINKKFLKKLNKQLKKISNISNLLI
jgi:hypothetical protein